MPDPIGGVQPFAELARGEASVVYKGLRQTDNRLVLLKTMRPEGGDEDLIARFEEEARLAAQVEHPNVVAVLDAGREGTTAYLVTEFVEGLDLGALIGQGPLPPALAVYVLHEAVQGLAAVHAEGILHRDLKPANLLVASDGAVKLTDFGLASLAPTEAMRGPADNEVRGTLGYLAPEIVRGDPPSPASDLFALGVVLVEMLAGRAAFQRETTGATLDAVLHHDPTLTLAADPRVPSALTDLVADLLRKDPQDRPANAAAVAEALAPIRAQCPAKADDLAVFLSNPEAYVPRVGLVPPDSDARQEAPDRAASQSNTATQRRLGWRVVVGVFVIAIMGVVGANLLSDRPENAVTQTVPDSLSSFTTDSVETPLAILPDTIREASTLAETVEEPQPPVVSPEPIASVPDQVPETPVTAEDVEPGSAELPDSLGGRSETMAPGTLVVVAEPWAQVHVDGNDMGTTPLGAISLLPGRHTVTFENPDFPTYSVDLDITSGGEERLAVSLWDLVGRVTLVVRPWAEVMVNGTYWDTVPPQERPLVLTSGTHRLSFSHPSLGTQEATLRIAAGESRTLRIDLSEQAP